MPSHIDRWVIGALFALLGLGGLYLASRATDDVMYFSGIILFLVAFVFNFLQVKAVFDERDRRAHEQERHAREQDSRGAQSAAQ